LIFALAACAVCSFADAQNENTQNKGTQTERVLPAEFCGNLHGTGWGSLRIFHFFLLFYFSICMDCVLAELASKIKV